MKMELAEIFPSRFLKASDLQGKEHRVKIESVKPEQLGDQTKLVISFVDRAKQFVSNKTNSNTIAGAFGTNTDSWIGGEIILFAATVSGPNGLVQGIRCRAMPRATAPIKTATGGGGANDPRPEPPPFDDDIPW